jgi:hypothetical protein
LGGNKKFYNKKQKIFCEKTSEETKVKHKRRKKRKEKSNKRQKQRNIVVP